ncbi:MAG: hypothetical protein WA139_04880 [Candidatus Aenigmatarchaeota archaeon]
MFKHHLCDKAITTTALNFALKWFDIEDESYDCFYDISWTQPKPMKVVSIRNMESALSDFLTSLYESDRGFFQNFFSFILKEEKTNIYSTDLKYIEAELLALGFVYDGQILKTTSGVSNLETKITTKVEDELKKINPKLLEMRQGAIEALLSNKPDKARHVSASCRALIDNLLRELVPEIEAEKDESKIKKRLEKIFKDSESNEELVAATTKLIQALTTVQAKGSHSSITEETSIFVLELTDKLIYFILTMRK